MSYIVKIENERDQITLEWMSERGYDAGFYDVATFQGCDDEGRYVYSLEEHEAWQVSEAVNEDPHAFLTCCGSDTLSNTLNDFLLEIV